MTRCANYNNVSCPKTKDANNFISLNAEIQKDFPNNLTATFELHSLLFPCSVNYTLCETCTPNMINFAKSKGHKVFQDVARTNLPSNINRGYFITSEDGDFKSGDLVQI